MAKSSVERNTEKVPTELKKSIREQANYQCQKCSATQSIFVKIEIHHIVYRSNGGSNDRDNLMPLCTACHRDLHRNNN